MAQCREYVDLFLLVGRDRMVPDAACLVAKSLERFQALAGLERSRRRTRDITFPRRDIRRAHGSLVLQTKNPRLVPLPARDVDRALHLARALLARGDDARVGLGPHLFCGP